MIVERWFVNAECFDSIFHYALYADPPSDRLLNQTLAPYVYLFFPMKAFHHSSYKLSINERAFAGDQDVWFVIQSMSDVFAVSRNRDSTSFPWLRKSGQRKQGFQVLSSRTYSGNRARGPWHIFSSTLYWCIVFVSSLIEVQRCGGWPTPPGTHPNRRYIAFNDTCLTTGEKKNSWKEISE